MEIIKENNSNILIPEKGYLLHDKSEVVEEDQSPYVTDKVYLAKSITTLEQCEKIWEEINNFKLEEESGDE